VVIPKITFWTLLKLFKTSIPGEIFGRKMKEVTRNWRRQH
jgi:hypothetical protein